MLGLLGRIYVMQLAEQNPPLGLLDGYHAMALSILTSLTWLNTALGRFFGHDSQRRCAGPAWGRRGGSGPPRLPIWKDAKQRRWQPNRPRRFAGESPCESASSPPSAHHRPLPVPPFPPLSTLLGQHVQPGGTKHGHLPCRHAGCVDSTKIRRVYLDADVPPYILLHHPQWRARSLLMTPRSSNMSGLATSSARSSSWARTTTFPPRCVSRLRTFPWVPY